MSLTKKGTDLNSLGGVKFELELDHLIPTEDVDGKYRVYFYDDTYTERYYVSGSQYIGRGIYNIKNLDGSTVSPGLINLQF